MSGNARGPSTAFNLIYRLGQVREQPPSPPPRPPDAATAPLPLPPTLPLLLCTPPRLPCSCALPPSRSA